MYTNLGHTVRPSSQEEGGEEREREGRRTEGKEVGGRRQREADREKKTDREEGRGERSLEREGKERGGEGKEGRGQGRLGEDTLSGAQLCSRGINPASKATSHPQVQNKNPVLTPKYSEAQLMCTAKKSEQV